MRVEIADEVFVRARRCDVHAYLSDVCGYGAWWPGVRSRPDRGGASVELRRGPRGAHPQRLRVQVAKNRPDLGVLMTVRGSIAGSAEWYYLDEVDGTVVHYLLHAETAARDAKRRLVAHRRSVRDGLDALKDLLESGRRPGAEPGPALLRAQAIGAADMRARMLARGRELDPELHP